MPKYNFMISKAVDVVARKLAGMDTDTVARLTQVLSEEAQTISEELQHNGQNVSSDILAAKLEGIVARMKYEIRNQGPDPSPHEFPIFNVSHNPEAPYPNPINHLYDKRYKEAYATYIKQDQPASSSSQKTEPSTPTTPPSPSQSAPQPPTNPKPPSHAVYPQGQYQQQSNKQAQQLPPTNPAPSPHAAYPQGQYQQQSNKQALPQSAGAAPSFHQQPTGGWQYVNPYATMPRSHAAYYQQQAARMMQPIQEHSAANTAPPIRRSSTGEDFQSHPLSRSASSNDVNYSTNPGAEKIRVRVINDNSYLPSGQPQTGTYPNSQYNTQRSILKPPGSGGDSKEAARTRTIYAPPNTEIGTETMEDLFKVANSQRSESSRSTASPMTERVIIIDRRGGSPSDSNQNSSGQERYRAFEIRSSTGAPTSSTPTPATTTTSSSNPTTNPSPGAYAMQQAPYYPGQQAFYQQPKIYGSVPSNLYSAGSPYVMGGNNFYPYPFYRY